MSERRDAPLQWPTKRPRLKAGERFWKRLDDADTPGVFIGYRRGPQGPKWLWRRLKEGGGAYDVFSLGIFADDADFVPPPGEEVVSYGQVAEKVRALVTARHEKTKDAPLTVKAACEDYVAYLRAHKKTGTDAEQRLAKHVLPKIGHLLVAELTSREIEKVQRGMVRDGDPEVVRRSKDNANRVMSYLRAALNRAFEEPRNRIASSAAWDRVKQFHGVSRPRLVLLDDAQIARLINTTEGNFRNLVVGALLTGARPPHELAALRVRQFNAKLGTLAIEESKTGPRSVVLTAEAVEFLKRLSAGRHPDHLLFPLSREEKDGKVIEEAWGRADHIRPMKEARERAKLPAKTSMYSLRHSHISHAIIAGMPLTVLAENCGTSVRMIEENYAHVLASTRRQLIEERGFKLGVALPNGNVAPLTN